MKSTNINTPLWIFDSVSIDELKILPVICELPNNPLFGQLEVINEFNAAITNQLIEILKTLQGNLPKGTLIKNDFESVLDNDHDVILLMFQKEYKRTTQTTTVALNNTVDSKLLSKYNEKYTADIYRNGKIYKKFNVTLLIDDRNLRYAYYGTSEVTPVDIERLQKKIM
jgi:hypothetical protein